MSPMEPLRNHAKSIKIELISEIVPQQPVRFRYSCRHKCEIEKTIKQIMDMKSGECPMCCDGIQVAMEIVETQLMEHHLTIQQIQDLQEDYHTIACLYALTKHVPGTVVSDMIRIWKRQEGNCAKCKCKLYPTLSTRAMHIRQNRNRRDNHLIYCEDC